MSFGFDLKALISKATKEYTTVAKNDPIISSTDDNTSRGDELDFILSQQAAERKALWDKLYNVINTVAHPEKLPLQTWFY